ncbi:hypothetical protein OTK49_21070 [Vibrio coralliirubri]|uniref:hypothetical protein n=1 Tax=Vibrio coralliirubri TaxID=1516159 RepID=UPI00228354BB|nr:hypothetical protein [Vibrio coralliirubri]MCY9865012.1 hypothetical protein [Vibrio coralliirubri]
MNLIHTQKQFNCVVATTKKNLEARGVVVDRRDLEESIAPALAGGQSHAVMSSTLKALPRSNEAIMGKYVTSKGSGDAVATIFVDMVEQLHKESEACLSFLSKYKTYKRYLVEIFDKIMARIDSKGEVGYQESEFASVLRDVLDSIKHDKRFDLFSIVVSHHDSVDDDGLFEVLAHAEFRFKIGNKTLHIGGSVDPEIVAVDSFDDCTVNGKEIDSNVVLVYVDEIISKVVGVVGMNNVFTNEFSTHFSPELLLTMFEECQKIEQGDSVIGFE